MGTEVNVVGDAAPDFGLIDGIEDLEKWDKTMYGYAAK